MPRHSVYAIDTVSVRTPGSKYPTSIRKGDRWWSDHPIVREHPAVFSVDDPREVFPRGWQDTPEVVEQATAAPGEKRSTRRAAVDAD
jgi:hypothetical protein